jgi:hypothetical protein
MCARRELSSVVHSLEKKQQESRRLKIKESSMTVAIKDIVHNTYDI